MIPFTVYSTKGKMTLIDHNHANFLKAEKKESALSWAWIFEDTCTGI
jgi:hypothetical protein